MQEKYNQDTVTECSCFCHSSYQSLLFFIVKVAGGCLFLSDQLHCSRRVVGHTVILHGPGKIAFETDQSTIHGSWFLSLILLKVGTVAGQCWSRDRLQVERSVRKSLVAACCKTRLVPYKKVAKVAEIVANGCRREIFSILEGLLILSYCLFSGGS